VRRLADLHERTASAAPPLSGLPNAVANVDAAIGAVDRALGILDNATRNLVQAAESPPHRRAAFIFANFADNLGGSLAELEEMLDSMRGA